MAQILDLDLVPFFVKEVGMLQSKFEESSFS
jgi:hypothetical protein